MSQPNVPGRQHPSEERVSTVLETDEDVRQALLAHVRPQSPAPAPAANSAGDAAAQASGGRVLGRSATPFRPTVRPPVPILTVLDDGKADGESIRLRDQRFLIGRTDGDLRFPLDGRMSSRHVEITHQTVGGLHRWVVTDLQSTHGLFVRVSRSVLADQAEFLVGNGRYRFESNRAERDATVDTLPNEPRSSETQGWTDGTGQFRPPAITELLGREIGNRIVLVKNEYWIGSDPGCSIVRGDDPFCEPRHARVFQGSRAVWYVEHNKTQNGLWLRMAQVTVDSTAQFQIGEQRFKLKVQ